MFVSVMNVSTKTVKRIALACVFVRGLVCRRKSAMTSSLYCSLRPVGSSPVSTNQIFDDGFSTKDIGVDLAYLDWKINDNLNFYGGKMKNPLYKAGGVPLIWDGDLNPEGFAVKYTSGNFFGTVGGFSAEERSSSDDSLLYVAQAGMKFPLGDAASLTAGVGYFAYTDTIGNEPFYDGSANGNSVDLDGDYIYDYKNTELFAEMSTRVGDWPLKIYAHATQNSDVAHGRHGVRGWCQARLGQERRRDGVQLDVYGY